MKTVIVWLAVAGSLASAPALAADLLEIFRRAQQQDAAYASARAAWTASREKLPQGRALLLPSASLSGNANYNDRTIEFRNGISSIDKYSASSISASVTQPLYRPQNLVQYEQAKAQLAQADAQVAAALQELIVRVAQAYFDVLLARDNIEFARAQKTAISQQYVLAKKSYDLGTATITDLHEAQSRHDLVTSQEIAALNDLESRQRVLQHILNAEPPAVTPVREGFVPSPPQPNNMQAWVDEALRNSLQVQAQAAATEIAEKEVQRHRASHMPTLDLVLTHLRSAAGSGIQGGPGLDTVASGVGVQLAVPLYQGGAVSSRVREAVANLTRANDDLDHARRTAALNARQAFLGISHGVTQIAALRSAVSSSERQLDSTQLGRRVGVRTIVDVLNTQQQLYSARRDLAQATYAYILNNLRLKLAAGTLSESDVERVNGWLGGSPVRADRRSEVTVADMAAPERTLEAGLRVSEIVRPYIHAKPDGSNGDDGKNRTSTLALRLTQSISSSALARASQKQPRSR